MRLFSSFVWLPFLFLFPLTGTGQRVGNLSSEKGNPGVVQETERRNDGNISFYLAGSGTEENPYLVGSVSDLSKIARESVDFEGVYFRQTGHIDMEKESEGGFIGTFYNRSLPFKGHYDGGGFEIRNLVIDFLPNKFIDGISSIYLGLFGRLGSGASLRNIILDSSCKILIDKWELQICANNYELYSPGFSTCYVYVGPVVAYAEEGASVSNCHSRARIAFNAKAGLDRTFPLRQFNFHIGGVAGYSQGDVYASSFAGSIYIFDSIRMYFTPVFYTGGVVGEAASVMACRNTGTISYSVNSGSIGGSSDNTVGGVAGRAREARYCYNTASIGIYAKNHFYTGGILGSGNVVRHCYNRGTIFDPEFPDGNSATYSAGIVGVGYDGFFDPVDAVSCVYNTGDIEADGKDGWTSGGTAAHITSCKDHEKVEIDTAYYLQSAQLRGTNRIEDGQSLSAAELSSEEILRQLQKGCSFWKSGTGEDGEEFPWLDLRCTVRFEEGLDQTKEMLVPAYTCLDYKSERPGYEFAGWFTDEARTKPWDFSYPVTQDMTLYAAYVSVEWTAHAASAFAGGDGSAEAPYLIETPEQLALLAKQAREQNYVTRGKHYRLQADLDLASIAAEPDIPAEWVPIGAGPDSLAFRGCFDGNGHKIANLVQSKPVSFYGFESSKDKPVYRGLFGVATGADIRNLSLENVSISQRSPEKNVPIEAINHYEIPPFSLSAASLIGRADSCSISACSVQGFIRIDDPSVYYSFNSSAYTYDVCLGGLVGTALSCRITDSRADMVFSVRDTLSRSMVSGQSLSLGVCAGGLISWGQENYLENIFCHSMQTSVASRPDGYGSYDYEPIFVGGGIVGFSRSDTLFLVASEGNIRMEGSDVSGDAGGMIGHSFNSEIVSGYSHLDINTSATKARAGGILAGNRYGDDNLVQGVYVTGDILSGAEVGRFAPMWFGTRNEERNLHLQTQILQGTDTNTKVVSRGVSEDFLRSDSAVIILNGSPSTHAFRLDREGVNRGYPVFDNDTVLLSFETFGGAELAPIKVPGRKKMKEVLPVEVQWQYAADEDGYAEFQQWCVDSELYTAVHPDSLVDRDRTVYAKFTTVICFESNGGSDVEKKTYTVGQPFSRMGDFPEPYRSGWIFDGWFLDKECRNPVSVSDKVRPWGTLYARYRIEVQFNAQGGSYYPMSENRYVVGFPYGDAENPEFPVPEKAGYHFGGWYRSPVFTDQRFATDIVPFTPDTLYAVWGDRVTVFFDSRGGSGVDSREYYPQRAYNRIYIDEGGQRFNEGFPDNPVKENASFIGWFDAGLQREILPGSTVPDTNHTLYAKWSVPVQVRFETDGGNALDPISYQSGYPYTHYGNTVRYLPTPVKENAIFAGWYDSPDFGQPVTASSIVGDTDYTLYAKWSEPLSISFETFGICGDIGERSYYPGFAYRDWNTSDNPGLPDYMPDIAEGYRFAGWYDSPDFTNRITNTSIVAEDVHTLYARWSQVRTITFSSDFECADASREYYPGFTFYEDGVNPGLPENFYNTDGFYFMGWYTDPAFTVKVTNTSLVEEDIHTLYAQWNTAQTVSFETSGGEAVADRSYVPGYAYRDYSVGNGGLPTTTLAGYYFLGWYADPDFTVEVNDNTLVGKEVRILYAKWSSLLKVRFETLGGAEIADREYHSGKAFNSSGNPGLPTASKEGARFLGWYDSPEYLYGFENSDIVPETLHTLYAKWAEPTRCTFVDFREDRVEVKDFFHHIAYNQSPNTGFVNWTSSTTPVFVGWFAHIGKLLSEVRLSDTVPDRRHTLHARWCIEVMFNTNGGNVLESRLYDPLLAYGEEPNGGLPRPYRAGFSFTGWFSDPGLTVEVDESSSVPDRDHTLYAAWKGATKVSVHFETNGAPAIAQVLYQADGLAYGDEPNPGLPVPVWAGHRFGGWFSDAGLVEEVTDRTVVPAENHTLYASWTEEGPDPGPGETYVTVSFHTGNGAYVADRKYRADGLAYGEEPNPGLPVPMWTGHRFEGWFSDRECTQAVNDQSPVPGFDHTLYAGWEKVGNRQDDLADRIRIYPNPTGGICHIESPVAITDVYLFRQDGKQLRHWRDDREGIDLGNLPSGVYVLRIDTEKASVYRRVVRY